MKYTIVAIAIATTLILLMAFNKKQKTKKKEQFLLDYIKENPDKSALNLIRNGEEVVKLNNNKMFPLASTVKIIIAIEYAEQAAAGIIDPEQIITFDELDSYFVPGTDGGAHMAWFKAVQKKIKNDGVSLYEVAKGMIMYSSNANTEYLMDLLTVEKVNERLGLLGIKDHSFIYYIVSALFVGMEKFPDLKNMELAEAITEMSDEEYHGTIMEIHEKLKRSPEYKSNLGALDLGTQKAWSDRLPASTVKEYAILMSKINGRTFFSQEVHVHLSTVLESIMENPANQKLFEHSGMKGGSTAFVLTKALYATDKESNTTSLAYFLNDVGFLERGRLQNAMNAFELAILTNPEFVEEVAKDLGGL